VSYIPAHGDVVWLTFDPQEGREQAGRRPALVLTPQLYNGKTSLAVMCPITNQQKGYPFEVAIPDDVEVSGVILADQLKSLDWRARRAAFKAKLPEPTMAEVEGKIRALLGMG